MNGRLSKEIKITARCSPDMFYQEYQRSKGGKEKNIPVAA
jgi:hypothetical protein